MNNLKALNLVKIPMMTVVIIICSWIYIPFPIPFTMQTFGIYCTLLLLGGRAGTLSLVLYTLLGIIGLPVFSGFSAGIGHLMTPTGGYIWGFLLCAVLYLLTEKITKSNYLRKAVTLFTGTLLCYAVGTVWFIFFSGTLDSLWYTVAICILPFVIPDIIKIIFAIFLSKKLEPLINKTIKE